MKSEGIKIMLETERLKLNKSQLFSHFFVILFILILPTLCFYTIFKIEVLGSIEFKTTQELLYMSIPWLILAIVFLIIQYYRLNFIKINKKVTGEDFIRIIQITGKERNWKILILTNDYSVARRGFNWTGSWGERITIIRKENEILINSICDPDKRSSVSSWGQNKKNIKAFEKNLNTLS